MWFWFVLSLGFWLRLISFMWKVASKASDAQKQLVWQRGKKHPMGCVLSNYLSQVFIESFYSFFLPKKAAHEVIIPGWWFQRFFIFTPILGEMIQFDEHIFQMGWFNHQLDTIYIHLNPALGCINPVNNGTNDQCNWLAGFQPSTVIPFYHFPVATYPNQGLSSAFRCLLESYLAKPWRWKCPMDENWRWWCPMVLDRTTGFWFFEIWEVSNCHSSILNIWISNIFSVVPVFIVFFLRVFRN